MKLTTLACLFVGRNAGLAVQLLEPPLPDQLQIPPVPPGMMHAIRVLGLSHTVRVFKLTAQDRIPVYEEV